MTFETESLFNFGVYNYWFALQRVEAGDAATRLKRDVVAGPGITQAHRI